MTQIPKKERKKKEDERNNDDYRTGSCFFQQLDGVPPMWAGQSGLARAVVNVGMHTRIERHNKRTSLCGIPANIRYSVILDM